MPRNTKQKANKTEVAVEDVDIPSLSQQSGVSEENEEIRETVKQYYKNALEKKQKEKVKKFIETKQRDLSKLISNTTSNLMTCAAAMDEDFTQFTLEYATYEDEIRKRWSLILEKQKLLYDLAVELNARSTSESENVGASQIAALSQIRAACQDCQALVDQEFHLEI